MFNIINITPLPIDWKYCRKIFYMIKTNKSNILDVGCGDGQKTKYVTGDGCGLSFLIGLDLSSEKLKIAKRRNILPVLADLASLPFADESYDIIMSFHTIEHTNVSNVKLFLKEAYRTLKKGGYLLLVTPNAKRLSSLVYRLLGFNKYPMNPDHVFEYTREDLLHILQDFKLFKYHILPYFFGIHLKNIYIGFSVPPRGFSKFCNFWIILAQK